MIKLYNLIPKVYYNKSRDFQVLARPFEVIYNYLKTNADLVNVNATAKNSDITILQLLLKTVGFDKKHNYSEEDIRAICLVFADILRNKGSIQSIIKAINVLLNTQHITMNIPEGESLVTVDSNDRFNLIIRLPVEFQRVKDVILLEDLFDYILPAGFTYNLMYVKFSKDNAKSKYDFISDVSIYPYKDTATFAERNVLLGRVAFNDDKDIANMTEQERQASISETGLGTYYTGIVVKPLNEGQGDN